MSPEGYRVVVYSGEGKSGEGESFIGNMGLSKLTPAFSLSSAQHFIEVQAGKLGEFFGKRKVDVESMGEVPFVED